jgi:hypothetical protein
MKETVELTRHGTTPAKFLAYVRRVIREKGFKGICAGDINLRYWAAGNDIEFDYHDEPDRPCKAERSISKPYQMQTYVLNWDGTVYNMILEFDFWDEKTGLGYFYFLNEIN